jgi:hypothetical protein
MLNSIHEAQDLLGTYLPAFLGGDPQPLAKSLITEARKILSEALVAGDVRVARWLCHRFDSAMRGDKPGIVAQLRPLIDDLPKVARISREIACLAVRIGRDLQHSELYQASLFGAREALKTG